jgi:excisionase family DNA binding protein
MSDEKILLTVREVVVLTGFSEGTLRHWVSSKKIPFVRISNRCVRFQKDAILRWLAEKSVGAVDRG